jgi:hypothetical protein
MAPGRPRNAALHRPSVVSGADAGGRLRGVPAAGERFGLELGGARENVRTSPANT